MASGTGRVGVHKHNQEESKLITGSLVLNSLAGTTNQGPLSFWLMAMVLYPRTQQLAQEEIDSVVGRERPPTWEDYEKIPYLQAMVRELLRWRPTSPLGLIHIATEVRLAIVMIEDACADQSLSVRMFLTKATRSPKARYCCLISGPSTVAHPSTALMHTSSTHPGFLTPTRMSSSHQLPTLRARARWSLGLAAGFALAVP